MLQMRKGSRLELAVDQIYVNPDQPRKIFEEEELEELSSSIREFGVIQPLLVTKGENGKYLLIAGERRLRASKMAGLKKVPVVIREADEKEVALISIIENVQRENLSYMEEALAYRRLTEEYGLTQAEIARKVGKKQSTISNKIRLLMLPEEDQLMLAEYGLTERHARALLKLPGEAEKLSAIAVIARLGLSVARTESYIEALLAGKAEKPGKIDLGAFLNNLSQTLQKIQQSGIPAISERRETDRQIVLTITIPK